jgi:hypothetical protein
MPMIITETTTSQINYILYHIRHNTVVEQKFNISIAHLQLEVGSFTPFFSLPFTHYGDLTTKSYVKQLWAETNL